MIVQGPEHRYQVGNLVANTRHYRLYLCRQDDTMRQCLLQIASDIGHNGALDRVAFFLHELKAEADRLEAEYAKIKTEPNHFLNYDLGFPELIDNFTCPEQGNRRINILTFRGIDDINRLVPLSNIINKDHRRVDLRTSAWIMGKILKLLVFTHGANIAIGRLDTTNILIEPKEHYVVLFDWSEARTYPELIPAEIRKLEISQASKAVITILGGNSETRNFPDDVSEELKVYTNHLLALASGSQHNAEVAHTRFYQIIDTLWERGFYAFTSHPL
jgi:hypothetical protein